MSAKVPVGTVAKDIQCNINSTTIKTTVKNQELLNGQLFSKVRSDECIWSLEGTTLSISLEKVQETWWSSVLKSDVVKIDTTKVDSTKRVSEYDESTQGAIRKIMV